VLLLRVRVGATSVAGDPAVAVEIAEMRVRDPRADRGLDLQAHRRSGVLKASVRLRLLLPRRRLWRLRP